MQTWANMCGDRSLELAINAEGLLALQQCASTHPNSAAAVPILRELEGLLLQPAAKQVDALLSSSKCARALGELSS